MVGKVLGWYFPALICTAIWAMTDFGGYFWPIWVFFGLSIPAGLAVIAWLSGGDDDGDGHTADDDDERGDPAIGGGSGRDS
jgi:hypothetical protein